MIIDVITPALNEEKAIASVIRDIPKGLIRHFIVCDNGSFDRTAEIARSMGALVIHEPERGYGAACLKGIAYLKDLPIDKQPDIVVFIDADYSDFPEEIPELVRPILEGKADLVIGSRVLGNADRGSLTFVQRFGNALATLLIRLIYGYQFTDLGPFRAIRFKTLLELGMKDRNFGWTVEMQIRAAKLKISATEIPVNYKNRIGKSKVSGTVKGSILAGYKIIYTIFKLL
ncbi:MAG: glycosyltransferase family 2 protein [Saprospiraceae bacterium]|nr:glycosyltransferase family 2 protein [Candidatus Vicinibacter proximus]MBL7823488.1 glycosyltransferase family 2 protein [Saprospiraceae bacterium]HRG33451.1 glycosyltransferase family 2 protein [Saprospiraceae bacterium]